MKSFLLSLAAVLVVFGYLVDAATYVTKQVDKMEWGPMACSTNDFKHDRYDGEEFDMEAQVEAKTVKIEEANSGKFHLRIQLEDGVNPKYFLGNWTCGGELWIVVGAPFISRLGKPSDENLLRPSLAVMEEEKVKLRCEAFYFGEEVPSFTWAVLSEEGGEKLNLTNRWEQTDDKEGGIEFASVLELKDEKGIQMTDRANYTCTVSVQSGDFAIRGILLRVKDKFAALWPFLGICAEVIILCIGIFIYERRTKARNVEGDEEDETADAQVVSGDDAKAEEVRKRAPVKT